MQVEPCTVCNRHLRARHAALMVDGQSRLLLDTPDGEERWGEGWLVDKGERHRGRRKLT
jgi:hypothetical protein